MEKRNVEKFVRKYADLVYRIAFTILKNKENAEDVFQDIFLKLYSSNMKFINEEHEKAWIIKVTKNQCLDFLKRKCNQTDELDENIETDEMESYQYVLDEVMKLPDKNRIVIYLHYFEGYKIEEMAELLNENVSTLKSRLVKSREILKDRLKEEF